MDQANRFADLQICGRRRQNVRRPDILVDLQKINLPIHSFRPFFQPKFGDAIFGPERKE